MESPKGMLSILQAINNVYSWFLSDEEDVDPLHRHNPETCTNPCQCQLLAESLLLLHQQSITDADFLYRILTLSNMPRDFVCYIAGFTI